MVNTGPFRRAGKPSRLPPNPFGAPGRHVGPYRALFFFAERPWWPPLSLFGRRKGQGRGGRKAFGKLPDAMAAARHTSTALGRHYIPLWEQTAGGKVCFWNKFVLSFCRGGLALNETSHSEKKG